MENRDYYQYLRSKNFGESQMEGANRKRALPIHNQPAAKRPVPLPPSPPIVHPLQTPPLLTQLLAYCTPAQRLHRTLFVSREFQQASLHPTAWYKVICVRMCNRYIFQQVPPRALLVIKMNNLAADDEHHDVKCTRVRDLLMRMTNIRGLMLDGSAPFSVMYHLFHLLPSMNHLKQLHLVFIEEQLSNARSLHTLMRDVLPLCDSPERLHLHIQMLPAQPWNSRPFSMCLDKHTIQMAASLNCTIDNLKLGFMPVRFQSSAEVNSLVDAFAGVRLSQLVINPYLVQPRDPNEQMLVVGMVNKLAPGSLKRIVWQFPFSLPATVTGSIREVLGAMHNTQLSQVKVFDSLSTSCRGFPGDIGFYNSCNRLTTTMTEFLVKMPKLQALTFRPCHALASPFVFEKEPFMLMVQCFMQRAMQHKQSFKVVLTNVLDMKGVNVDDELETAYPCKQYGLTIKHYVDMAHSSFTLKIVHSATERTLKLCIDTVNVDVDA